MADIDDFTKKIAIQASRRRKAFEKEMHRINRRRAKLERQKIRTRTKAERSAQKRAEQLAARALKQARRAAKGASDDVQLERLQALVEQRKSERATIEQIGIQLRAVRKASMQESKRLERWRPEYPTDSSLSGYESGAAYVDPVDSKLDTEDTALNTESSESFQTSISTAEGSDVLLVEPVVLDQHDKEANTNDSAPILPNALSTDSDTPTSPSIVSESINDTDAQLSTSRRELDRQRRISDRERKRADRLIEAEAEAERRAAQAERKLQERLEKDREVAERLIARRNEPRRSLFGRTKESKSSNSAQTPTSDTGVDASASAEKGVLTGSGINTGSSRQVRRVDNSAARRAKRQEASEQRKIERERITAERIERDAQRAADKERRRQESDMEKARLRAETASRKEQRSAEKLNEVERKGSTKRRSIFASRKAEEDVQKINTISEEFSTTDETIQVQLTGGAESSLPHSPILDTSPDTRLIKQSKRDERARLRKEEKEEALAREENKRAEKKVAKAERDRLRQEEKDQAAALKAEKVEERKNKRAEKQAENIERDRLRQEKKDQSSTFERDSRLAEEDKRAEEDLQRNKAEEVARTESAQQRDSEKAEREEITRLRKETREKSKAEKKARRTNVEVNSKETQTSGESSIAEESSIGSDTLSDTSDVSTDEPAHLSARELRRLKRTERLRELQARSIDDRETVPQPRGFLARLLSRGQRLNSAELELLAKDLTVEGLTSISSKTEKIWSEHIPDMDIIPALDLLDPDTGVEQNKIEDATHSEFISDDLSDLPSVSVEELLHSVVEQEISSPSEEVAVEEAGTEEILEIDSSQSRTPVDEQLLEIDSSVAIDGPLDQSVADILNIEHEALDEKAVDDLVAALPSSFGARMREWISTLPTATQQRLTMQDVTRVASIWAAIDAGNLSDFKADLELDEIVLEVEIRPISGPVVTYAETSTDVETKDALKEEEEDEEESFVRSLFGRRKRTKKDDKKISSAERKAAASTQKLELLERKAAKKAEAAQKKEDTRLLREQGRLERAELEASRSKLRPVKELDVEGRKLRKVSKQAIKEAAKAGKAAQEAEDTNAERVNRLSLFKPASIKEYSDDVSVTPKKRDKNSAVTDPEPVVTTKAEIRSLARAERAASRADKRQRRSDEKAARNFARQSIKTEEADPELAKLDTTIRETAEKRKEIKTLARQEASARRSEIRRRRKSEKDDARAEARAEKERRSEASRVEFERRAAEARSKAAEREASRITRKVAQPETTERLESPQVGRYSWDIESGIGAPAAIGELVDHLEFDLPEALPPR